MRKEFKIVFMGTPEFAVGPLKSLIESGFDIAAVVTAPDRPAGRGRKMRQSAVKQFAESKAIPVLQPKNLKSPNFLEELAAYEADLQVVVAFRMLPKQVWAMPKKGTINLHASLLPDYRGAAPINWVLINGEERTGVTTFFIDEKIDTGEIIMQSEVKIDEKDNAGSLHDKLQDAGAKLLVKTVESIAEGSVTTRIQKDEKAINKAPKLTDELSRIDWDNPGSEIVNLIRGLSPYPGAWTILYEEGEESRLKIYEAEFEPDPTNTKPGTIILDKDGLMVVASDGYINLKSVQFSGKRRMPVKEVLNGLRLEKNAYLG